MFEKLDLTEQPFGLLTAKEIVGKDKRGTLWRCACECGGEKIVPATYLRNGHTTSCGCKGRNARQNTIKKGDRFGLLEAVEFAEYETKPDGKRRAVWLFQCDCGKRKKLPVANVKFANVRSCGCKATAHITNLKKQDITGETFDRLTAIRPTDERADNGSVVWEFACSCGNTTKMSVYRFHSHRVHSCGCLYRESRAMVNGLRRDIVNESSLSLIVYTKKRSTANQSGHPGVWYNKRSARWEAYINFRKKRYHLGSFKEKEEAVSARQSAEKKLHDPVVIEHFDDLTRESQETFIRYLLSARKEP